MRFLAMKITFINEIANLCEKVGANVQTLKDGRDGRISPVFTSVPVTAQLFRRIIGLGNFPGIRLSGDSSGTDGESE